VVEALQPRYGAVDFNRLNPISKNISENIFKSKYPRQQEVALAGAIDPDVVSRIEYTKVAVKKVGDIYGEPIAEEYDVSKRYILTRQANDPSVIVVRVYDGKDKLIRESYFKIKAQGKNYVAEETNL
jgi:hypothetical protein